MKELQEIQAREISIDTHGLNFLCIIGQHINGGFVAIPNWSIAAELARGEQGYNKHQIETALNNSKYASLWADDKAQAEIAEELAGALTALL
jgi:hypothetical protein